MADRAHRNRRALVACMLFALVAPVGGCPRRDRPAAPRIVEVRVLEAPLAAEGLEQPAAGEGGPSPSRPREPVEALRPVEVDQGALARRVTDGVRAAHLVEVAPGAAPRAGIDFRMTLYVRLLRDDGAGRGVLRAFVAARLVRAEAPLEPEIATQAIAERRFEAGRPLDPAAARAHLERATDDVVAALLRLLRLHLGGAADLVAALGGADQEVRFEAIRVAALRREREAVPALIALLRSGDPETRDRALGALVEIGDRRAVKPITEVARLGDTEALPKVIDAMGTLGGAEARAYLEFVISAHDDREMRELAQAALVRLQRRAAEADGGGEGERSPSAP